MLIDIPPTNTNLHTLSGRITGNGDTSLSCCTKVPDIQIDDQSLDRFIEELLPYDGEQGNKEGKDYRFSLRYIVSPRPLQGSIEEAVVRTITGDPEYAGVCYSEWTCGWGRLDYFHGVHDIIKELGSYVGQYVEIQITVSDDFRQ